MPKRKPIIENEGENKGNTKERKSMKWQKGNEIKREFFQKMGEKAGTCLVKKGNELVISKSNLMSVM